VLRLPAQIHHAGTGESFRLHEKRDRVPLTEHLNLDLFALVFFEIDQGLCRLKLGHREVPVRTAGCSLSVYDPCHLSGRIVIESMSLFCTKLT